MVKPPHPYMTTGKTIALTLWTFVGKVMSLLFNTLSMFVITFLPRSKCLLISWLQSLSIMILEPKKIKSVTVSFSPSVCLEVIEAENFPVVCCQKTGDPGSADIVPVHKLVISAFKKSHCFRLSLKAGRLMRQFRAVRWKRGSFTQEGQLCYSVQLCFFVVLAFSQ